MLQSFGVSEEAVTLFGNKTNDDKVKTLFQPILGRTPDTGGLLFYAGKLEDGSMTGITIAQNVFDGAKGSDAAMVANKLAVAKAFNTSLNTAEKKQHTQAPMQSLLCARCWLQWTVQVMQHQ